MTEFEVIKNALDRLNERLHIETYGDGDSTYVGVKIEDSDITLDFKDGKLVDVYNERYQAY